MHRRIILAPSCLFSEAPIRENETFPFECVRWFDTYRNFTIQRHGVASVFSNLRGPEPRTASTCPFFRLLLPGALWHAEKLSCTDC